MPTVFGSSLQSSVVEACGEVVQHPMRLGDDRPACKMASIAPRLVPVGASNIHPTRQPWSGVVWDDDADPAVGHLAEPVESARRRSGEESPIPEVERDRRASREERVG